MSENAEAHWWVIDRFGTKVTGPFYGSSRAEDEASALNSGGLPEFGPYTTHNDTEGAS